MPVAPGNIVLIGFMGAGKSEVARALAGRTGRVFVDTDELVVEDGMTIAGIFAAEGETGFRKHERRAIERASRMRGAVIATGGGSVLDQLNVSALRKGGVIVYLAVGADELQRRLTRDGPLRPLLRTAEGEVPDGPQLRKRLNRLLAERVPIYEAVADHVIACDGMSTTETADAIVRRLEPKALPDAGKTGPRSVRVDVVPSYDVKIGRGLLTRLKTTVRLSPEIESVCVVSHPRIRRLWGKALESGLKTQGRRVVWCTFPEGESRKTLETAGRISRFLASSGFHRSDLIAALGGGVVGDVSGFVASTYARGVPFIQIPTTLLGMVDASIGGKTGVNLPHGKNLVGTFHHPIAIVADIDVLATLPDRELRGGLAEVVKTAFILDPSLSMFVVDNRDEIFARGECIQTIVARCAKAKADVVASDERESGRRMILNYGHTLGHALEAASLASRSRSARTPPRLHHGEAVSIGMVFAAEVAVMMGLVGSEVIAEHKRVLEAVGLPTEAVGATWEDVRGFMSLDKKYRRGVRMVLLTAPGVAEVYPVPMKTLKAAFGRVAA